MAGNDGRLGEVKRQAVAGEPVDDLEGLLLAPVALVHMALQADGVDLDAGLQDAFDQAFEGGRHVEVVEHEEGLRVRLACRLERHPHGRDPAVGPADAGDAVLAVLEDRHDHGFVDRIPGVDQAAEVRDLAADASLLGVEDLAVGERQQPVGLDSVPAKRVSLESHAAVREPAGRGQNPSRVRLAALGLEAAPVERQRGEVEQSQPLFLEQLHLFPLFAVDLAVCERDEVETG